MVELTELKDNGSPFQDPQIEPLETVIQEARKQDSENLSDDEADSDSEEDDDEFDENETLWERFVALKDIIPPKQRHTISKYYQGTKSLVLTGFSKSSNLAWALTTTALLLGVPLSLSILAEQQLIEMEKSFDLQKDANDILAQGDSAPAAASA